MLHYQPRGSSFPAHGWLSLSQQEALPGHSSPLCFPKTILCNRAGLKTLPGEIAASTIALNLSNNYLRTLNTNTFRNLTFLHSLWLDGNNLTFVTPGTFHALGRLQELHLSRNSRLTYLHANTFRGLLNLISLDLSHCNIFEIHPLLFSHLPSLERLDLASNNMRYVPQAFRNLSSLTELSLEGNHIELTKLRYVFLSHNPWRCDCRTRWLWRWTATRRAVIHGLDCAFSSPANATERGDPRLGDLEDCTVPLEPATGDKCSVAGTSVAPAAPALPGRFVLLALAGHTWYSTRAWGTSLATF
uniref:Nyctalopin n=1 Tax=Malurus cyaneus samueli TaxID=2593467 RepID=A0A8C5U849_9PASS